MAITQKRIHNIIQSNGIFDIRFITEMHLVDVDSTLVVSVDVQHQTHDLGDFNSSQRELVTIQKI